MKTGIFPSRLFYSPRQIQRCTRHRPGIIIAILLILPVTVQPAVAGKNMGNPLSIELPEPRTDGGTSVEQALRQRRSVRTFAAKPLELAEVAQLLWSAQGITGRDGLRTAPSAGALYPLEIYLVAGNVNGLPAGIWHYLPGHHRLEQLDDIDVRIPLAHAALTRHGSGKPPRWWSLPWFTHAPVESMASAPIATSIWRPVMRLKTCFCKPFHLS